MANIATDVKWGSGPTNLFNFSYEKQRSGTTQQYKITVECEPCYGASYYGYPIYLEITVNGSVAATKTLKGASPARWSSSLTYTTGWISVANKTTGTTPIKIRIYSGSGSSRNTTYSYNLAIDPAGSLVGATDANIGSTSTVTFTRYNDAFTHTLAYMADGQASYTTIFSKQNVTSYPWTVPTSLYNLIPNNQTIDITLRCQTYSGSTLVGTAYAEMTATAAKSKCAPDVSITAVDTNEATIALTGSNKKIIKFQSDITATATLASKNGANLSSVTIKCGSDIAGFNLSGTTGTATKKITDVEDIDVSASVIDSREYPATKAATGLTLIEYIKLTANTTVARTSPTSDTVKVTTKGNYFNGSFGAVKNTIKAEIRYKPQTQAEYTDNDLYTTMTVIVSGNTYTATATLTGLDYTKAYDIRVRVQDKIYVYQGPLEDAKYSHTTISKGIPVFDWGENDFRFNVPLYSGGVNFTYVYQADSGAAGLAQGDTFTQLTPTPKYRFYYVRPTVSDGVSPANVYIPCTRLGNMLVGVGGYPHSSGRIDLFCVYITFTDDTTATVNYCGYWNTKEQSYAQRKVNGIFAVL